MTIHQAYQSTSYTTDRRDTRWLLIFLRAWQTEKNSGNIDATLQTVQILANTEVVLL